MATGSSTRAVRQVFMRFSGLLMRVRRSKPGRFDKSDASVGEGYANRETTQRRRPRSADPRAVHRSDAPHDRPAQAAARRRRAEHAEEAFAEMRTLFVAEA